MKAFNDRPLVKRKQDLENSIIVTVAWGIGFILCAGAVLAAILTK